MLRDMVHQTANNPGTSATCNLGSAVAPSRTFVASFGGGVDLYYVMRDSAGFEVGFGTVTAGSPDVLNRTTVLSNSLGTTARINFTGAVDVYCALPASRAVIRDQNGNVTVAGDATLAKASPLLALSKAAAGQAATLAGRTAGVDRWRVILGADDAEGGSNAGSSFRVDRYNDAGTLLGTALELRRSDGRATVLPPGIAPQPQSASGVGQWVNLFCLSGDPLVLPAGGTWAYLQYNYQTSGNVFTGLVLAGIGAGGATLSSNAVGFYFTGLAWRIA